MRLSIFLVSGLSAGLLIALLLAGVGMHDSAGEIARLNMRLALAESGEAGLLADRAGPASLQLRAAKYLKSLQGLNVRGCPPEFRAAWAEYLTDVQDFVQADKTPNKQAGIDLLSGLMIGDPLQATKGALIAIGTSRAEKSRQMELWRKAVDQRRRLQEISDSAS